MHNVERVINRKCTLIFRCIIVANSDLEHHSLPAVRRLESENIAVLNTLAKTLLSVLV